LLAKLDSVAWVKENNDPATGDDFLKVDGDYKPDTKSQTTTLTVKNGVNTDDTDYKCKVTRDGKTREKTVSLNVYG
jgi:hypothetical protein